MRLGKRRRRIVLLISALAAVFTFVIAANALSASLMESLTLSAIEGVPNTVQNELLNLRPVNSLPGASAVDSLLLGLADSLPSRVGTENLGLLATENLGTLQSEALALLSGDVQTARIEPRVAAP